MKCLNGKKLYTILAVWISFVFIQSGFFKFSGADETVHIFSTVGDWMTDMLHPILGELMTNYGAWIIGGAEYVASALLLMPIFNCLFKKSCSKDALFTFVGALMSFGIMTGAIFFHLFTPLGIEVMGDGGTLFGMAVSVWVSSLILIYAKRKAVL